MLEAFAWGLLAASSLVLGAVVVAVRRPGNEILGLIMAFGSGVLLSAVSFELVAEAVETSDNLASTAAGLFAGSTVFFVGDLLISRLGYRHRKDIDGKPPEGASALTIVLGTFLDGVPESAVLGLTLLQTGNIGVSMLVAVFVSNLPESIAASTSLRNGGWPLDRVLALWMSIAVASGISSALGFGLLDGAPPEALAFVLAFAGGAILGMLATSMMPEAFEHAGRPVGLLTTFGFVVAFGINWLGG